MPLGTRAAVGGLVLFGTFTSLAAKIVYSLEGVGRAGATKHFEKPWAMTTVMFLGMTCCLPLALAQDARARAARRAAPPESEPLLAAGGADGGGRSDAGSSERGLGAAREVALLAIPTAFDLAATVLMNVGLLSVTASVYQMLRGAEMLFAAGFAVAFLGRRLNRLHAAGIGCCAAGIALVGLSSLLAGEGAAPRGAAPRAAALGMGLVVASQAVQAAQVTFEDYFMADLAIAPLKIVGYEGALGAAAMLLGALPLVQRLPGAEGRGLHEDSVDTLAMVASSPRVAALLAADMAALAAYNVAGMCVTGHLGAVFRTVLETSRTLAVWAVDLGLFYGGGRGLGEAWTRYSWVQAAGFAVLVAGTVVYARGDEAEAAAEAGAGAEYAALGAEAGGAPAPAPAPAARPAPAAAAPAAPICISGSLRSTRSIAAYSLPRSLVASARLRHGPLSPGGALASPTRSVVSRASDAA